MTHNVTKELLDMIGADNLIAVSDLVFDPNNPNHHPEKNIEAIKSSLDQFGQDQFVVVQREGMIIRKGNGRVQAAIELGWTHVAAVVIDETDIAAMARGLADNRTSELSEWNEDILKNVVSQLIESDVDVSTLGWDEDEVYDMLEDDDQVASEASAAVETAEGFTRFQFGDHKGLVSDDVYTAFVAEYDKIKSVTGEVQIDDILRAWLLIPAGA